MRLNKEQTESVIDIGAAIAVIIIALISVHLFYTGVYDSIFKAFVLPYVFIVIGTVLGFIVGGIWLYMSIHKLNEARDDEKIS